MFESSDWMDVDVKDRVTLLNRCRLDEEGRDLLARVRSACAMGRIIVEKLILIA
jgi:hypothetical protein